MRRPLPRRVADMRRKMSLLSPPPIQRGGTQPPDDLDDVLRAFYKAQMPKAWPLLAVPAPRRTVPPPIARPAKGWPLMRSRLAVAASVALLAVGSLLLAGAFQGRSNAPADPIRVNGTSADSEYDPNQHPTPPRDDVPLKLKINESLIQEPNGTTIHVDVIDWPTTPK